LEPSNAKAIVHQMVRLLHIKWWGYCTSHGEATAHHMHKLLLYIKWQRR